MLPGAGIAKGNAAIFLPSGRFYIDPSQVFREAALIRVPNPGQGQHCTAGNADSGSAHGVWLHMRRRMQELEAAPCL